MATVRFSDQLKTEIRQNAMSLFDKKLIAAQSNFPPEITARGVYDLMFRDYSNAMNALPSEYFEVGKEIIITKVDNVELPEGVKHRGLALELDRVERWPEKIEAVRHGLMQDKQGRYSSLILDGGDTRWAGMTKAYVQYCVAIHDVEKEREVFVSGVEAVTTAYTTLAPALKAWPPLWDLIPSDKQEKHKEIVERKKKEITVEGVDLNAMTAVSTLAKLTGSN